MRYILCALFFVATVPCFSKEQVCNEGNFSLPPSQQPSSLVAFGENIIGKGITQVYISSSSSVGNSHHAVNLNPVVLYGIRDDLSALVVLPVDITNRAEKNRSSGIGDLAFQLEYAPIISSGSCYSHQWTVVANASFPTGSSKKNPPTGLGAMGYFIGTTYLYLATNWGAFTSYGVEIPASNNGTRYGNQYVYQYGVEWVFTSSKSVIFAGLLEVDGTFTEKNKIHGKKNDNSGGNLIYATPSLWVSSDTWILQIGCGFTLWEHSFGKQKTPWLFPVLQLRKTF